MQVFLQSNRFLTLLKNGQGCQHLDAQTDALHTRTRCPENLTQNHRVIDGHGKEFPHFILIWKHDR